ncbi:MAG TPA: hypothetical protein VF557_15910 [Jatrophihabitans sp.]|jgi:hypothetical protein|uniref:hypothetical protein n=1 Tax=Jatrophihabitans sp. TaxID=1932789 RepID=UPI002F03CFED
MDSSSGRGGQGGGVALWPLAGRDQLLNVYRPGAQPSEGPLRTLRSHHLLSDGVRIPFVEHNRLSGQMRMFCSLNLDAVRWARHGETAAAAAAAAAAAEIEQGTDFGSLCKLLSTRSPAEIRLVGAGSVGAAAIDGELGALLRRIAVKTERLRTEVHNRWQTSWEHTTVGWVLRRQDDFVLMATNEGFRTQVPLHWALRIHRADAGQALVLIIEDLDHVAIHSVFPGLWLSDPGLAEQPVTRVERPGSVDVVFGGPRTPRVSISDADADRLEKSEPLRVLVPVSVSE